MNHSYRIGTLTIANGETLSEKLEEAIGHTEGFLISAPETLPETVTVLVSIDGGDSYHPYNQDGSELTIPADNIVHVEVGAFDGIQLEAGAGTGADRVFDIMGLEHI